MEQEVARRIIKNLFYDQILQILYVFYAKTTKFRLFLHAHY